MPTMMRTYWSVLLCVGGLIVSVTLFAACGGSRNEERSAAINFGKATVASCLKNGGASFANSTDELDFLSQAEDNEEVSKFGFAYDKAAKVVVNVWNKAQFEDQPSEWTLWIGQPFGDQRSPVEIVDSNAPRSYVAFVVRPRPAARRQVNSCVQFAKGKSQGPSVTLHSSEFK